MLYCLENRQEKSVHVQYRYNHTPNYTVHINNEVTFFLVFSIGTWLNLWIGQTTSFVSGCLLYLSSYLKIQLHMDVCLLFISKSAFHDSHYTSE